MNRKLLLTEWLKRVTLCHWPSYGGRKKKLVLTFWICKSNCKQFLFGFFVSKVWGNRPHPSPVTASIRLQLHLCGHYKHKKTILINHPQTYSFYGKLSEYVNVIIQMCIKYIYSLMHIHVLSNTYSLLYALWAQIQK